MKRKRNPVARSLRSRHLHQRVVKDRTKYKRRDKHRHNED